VPQIAQVEPMTRTRALSGPFDYLVPDELRDGGVEVGSMLVVPFGRRDVLGVVVGLAEESEVEAHRLLEPRRALELGVPADLVELAGWIASEYCSTVARALALVLPPDATRRLGGRKRRAMAPPRHLHEGVRAAPAPSLTTDQQAVLDDLSEALSRRSGERRLVHGVTGSGKTEVYMRAAAQALETGRGVIVLAPEIALTPQIVERFIARFGDTVAVLHSQLRPAERYAEWRRLRSGEARVCVGPRSAVFAPISNLGLIVVDEEHEPSYKHEGDPRYDARDVAAERARACGALLLLGSATPRPESALRVARSSLPRRIDSRPLPEVNVLDMRGQTSALHPLTAHALGEVRAAGGKAIVLLNRRGWSNFLSCRTCGHVWSCPECEVSLVLHRAGAYVACHHCGHRERVPARCGECSSASVARHGAGTERLQHELGEIFDDGSFPVLRLDADAVAAAGPPPRNSGRGSAASGSPRGSGVFDHGAGALLAKFAALPAGALIGTQMVAKGHDFPDVSLGVVLDADATLRFPDFRAEERTFALIAQLAGRVGRGGEGHVLVQTIAPDARAIAHAARHDSDGFIESELEHRRALAYPPYSHLIRVVCSAIEAAPAHAAACALCSLLTDSLPTRSAQVLGPASLFRLRGRERQVLIVKSSERRGAVKMVGTAVAHLARERAHAEVNFSVDVDPQ
jgi:primosomal protein N' (replication factor Y) (superfamily II helicase)